MTDRVEEPDPLLPFPPTGVRLLVAGAFDRNHPRNALALAALVEAGVELVDERRLADAVWVGHPPLRSLPAARRAARGRPVIANALDELVAELRLARRQLLRLADLVVSETEASASALAARAGIARVRFAACPTGVQEEIFHPPWSAGVPFTCLTLAGGEVIAELARALPEVQFRIVGDRSLGLGAGGNISAVPGLDAEPLAHEVRRAGCLIGAADDPARTVPASAFLALACGTPLVTADTPAARELLEDGASALLVEPNDPDALARAVSRLNADFDLGRRLSAGGLAVFEARIGASARARRWRELIEGQIGTASRRR